MVSLLPHRQRATVPILTAKMLATRENVRRLLGNWSHRTNLPHSLVTRPTNNSQHFPSNATWRAAVFSQCLRETIAAFSFSSTLCAVPFSCFHFTFLFSNFSCSAPLQLPSGTISAARFAGVCKEFPLQLKTKRGKSVMKTIF